MPWRIKLEPGKAEQIRQTAVFQRIEKEGYQPLRVVADEEELCRSESGECFFLEDGLCAIHAEQGAAAKPTICRLYPFSLVATPDGYFASLIFTCPAVISGTGAPLQNLHDNLAQTVADAPHFFPPGMKPGNSVTFTSEWTASWSEYLSFEEMLLEQVESGRDLVEVLLEATALLLTGAQPEWNRTEKVDIVEHQMAEMIPLFVAHCMASIEEKSDTDRRAELAQSLLLGGEAMSPLLKSIAPAYRRVAPPDDISRQILRRYVYQKIFGKSLITGPTLTVRLLLLILCLEALRYYYVARKEQQSKLHFDPEALEWAFDYVETDLLIHHELVLPLMEEWERVGLQMSEALGSDPK